ncbi:hypothetical protein [Aquimarina megaterium]|nr:hypothetical protein [Aquimarina megaterium]
MKFDKQKISKLTHFKGKSIDYACAYGIIGGDLGSASDSCQNSNCDTTII